MINYSIKRLVAAPERSHRSGDLTEKAYSKNKLFKSSNSTKNKCLVIFILFLLLSGCYRSPHDARALRAENAKGDIVIGVVWPISKSNDYFVKGIDMALEEINKEGGVLGRKIKAIFKDSEGSSEKGKEIAREFTDNLDMVATVGYSTSDTAIPASLIYDYHGLLFISPAATNPEFTRHNFKYVFRSIPTDTEYGRKLAEYALEKKYNKIIIFNVSSVYGKGLADIFKIEAQDIGIDIVHRFSFNKRETNLKKFIMKFKNVLKNEKYDALFIAADASVGAIVIKFVRELGVTAPFIGGDALDSPELSKLAGKMAEGTVVASVALSTNQRAQDFRKRFYEKFGVKPDMWAAQGYDAVKILAFSMADARSTNPKKVANSLRYVENWEGVTGIHDFDENGDVVNKPIAFKILRNGSFENINRQK